MVSLVNGGAHLLLSLGLHRNLRKRQQLGKNWMCFQLAVIGKQVTYQLLNQFKFPLKKYFASSQTRKRKSYLRHDSLIDMMFMLCLCIIDLIHVGHGYITIKNICA